MTRLLGKVLLTLVPPLALIFLVLGSIIGGIATVNQAGAIGAVGAHDHGRLPPAGRRARALRAGADCARLAIAASCLSNYNMNVQNIQTAKMTGVIPWRDRRADHCLDRADLERLAHLQDRRHAARRDDRDGQDHLAGLHHPAGRGHADRGLPGLRRRGIVKHSSKVCRAASGPSSSSSWW
jgi:hypothetical protein